MVLFQPFLEIPEYDHADTAHPVEDAFAPPPTAPPALAPSATWGGLVAIFMQHADGRPDIEGWAWIVAPTGRKPFEYLVTFRGESPRRLRRRLVLPFQSDPETALRAMVALYDQTRSPIDLENFLSDLLAPTNDNIRADQEEA